MSYIETGLQAAANQLDDIRTASDKIVTWADADRKSRFNLIQWDSHAHVLAGTANCTYQVGTSRLAQKCDPCIDRVPSHSPIEDDDKAWCKSKCHRWSPCRSSDYKQSCHELQCPEGEPHCRLSLASGCAPPEKPQYASQPSTAAFVCAEAVRCPFPSRLTVEAVRGVLECTIPQCMDLSPELISAASGGMLADCQAAFDLFVKFQYAPCTVVLSTLSARVPQFGVFPTTTTFGDACPSLCGGCAQGGGPVTTQMRSATGKYRCPYWMTKDPIQQQYSDIEASRGYMDKSLAAKRRLGADPVFV